MRPVRGCSWTAYRFRFDSGPLHLRGSQLISLASEIKRGQPGCSRRAPQNTRRLEDAMARLLECVYVAFVGCCLHLRGPAFHGLPGALQEMQVMRRWWVVRRNNRPIDGVMAETPEAALRFGELRNVFRGGESISVTVGDPTLAYDLASRRDDEIADVRDFMVELGFPIWPASFMTRID
jgi:hypothetical protein